MHWDATAVCRARECGSSSLGEELKLVDNTFANQDCFRDFLDMLASLRNLRRLTLSVQDQPRLLSYLAASDVCAASRHRHHHYNHPLDELTLELHHRMNDNEAACFQTIVQIPRQRLTIRFSLAQPSGDYTACLLALERGQQEARDKNDISLLDVKLTNVSFPHHGKILLQRFAKQLVQTAVVTSLHLTPHNNNNNNAMGFVKIFPMLLTCKSLGELELGRIVILPGTPSSLDHQDGLFTAIHRALEHNTTLQSFSVPESAGLTRLWTQAIFPALASGKNTTLRRIEFGRTTGTTVIQDEEILVAFLQQLPRMPYLTSVKVPWHQQSFHSWMAALERMDTLQQIDFVHGEDYFNHDCPSAAVLQHQIRQHCLRNRLVAAARSFLTQAPQAAGVLQKLVEMDTQVHGFSASFVLVRGYAGPLIHL